MPAPFRTVRLRKHADYVLVYESSRKHRAGALSFFYRDRADGESSRFGITTPRALGNAVLRNCIKRRLRVAARASLGLLPAGTDVVLHPRPEVAAMAFPALENEIATIFRTVAERTVRGTNNAPLPRERRPKRARFAPAQGKQPPAQ